MGIRTMEKNGNTRRAASTTDTLSTREKRDRKRYLCDYIQKHRELTPADKAVGRLLVNWYNEKAGNCYASIERLANELELSRKTVKRAVGKLHRLGIVRRDIGGGWITSPGFTVIPTCFERRTRSVPFDTML